MKNSLKGKAKHHTPRDLFAELREVMKALAEERVGKRTGDISRTALAGQLMSDDVIALFVCEQDEKRAACRNGKTPQARFS